MASATDLSTYKFNHTMLRIKDPQETVKFYEFLGMSLLKHMNIPNMCDLYFMAYNAPGSPWQGHSLVDREGMLELRCDAGTGPDFVVNNGNREPHRGFGHICISVDNLQAACRRIEDAGYRFQKKLTDGRMSDIAFVLDPNGYWVEIIGQKPPKETEGITETDPTTYRKNHVMIRVKDAQKSLAWYQDVLGMKHMYTAEQQAAGFNLYFLCFDPQAKGLSKGMSSPERARAEGLLELTWNYGTEKDEAFRYHNGNDEPRGFGHIAIAVDNLEAACARFETMDLNWLSTLKEANQKQRSIYLLDPDGYSVQVIENDGR